MPTTKIAVKHASKTKSRKPAASATVGLTIDADLKRRWKKAAAVVADAKHRGMSAFDELWEAVAEISDHEPPLYLAAGCATFKAFLAEYVGEDERTAKRNMRVARFASPEEETKYGVSKIDAALSYLEAKAGTQLKGRLPVAFDRLKVPASVNGTQKNVPFAQATVQSLAVATRVLRAAGATKAKESPVVKRLRSALGADGLRAISIHYAAGKVTLGDIEPALLAKLGKALSRVHLADDAG